MRPLRSILLFFGVILIGGALVAPWLFFLAHWAAVHISGCENWARVPLYRFVNRSFILIAIVALPRFLRSLSLDGNVELRAALRSPRWTPSAKGIAIGFTSLAIVLACELLSGSRSWRTDHTQGEVCRFVIGAVATALIVAAIEELLFRWALYGSMRRVYANGFAVFLSSAIYAIVHFFSRPDAPIQVTWASGLALLPRMLRGFADIHSLMPGFFNLLLVGSILAVAYKRTGRLWLSVGLHAGWIFWLKSYGFWTLERHLGSPWFWGSDKMIDGWLAFFVLICTAVIVNLITKRGNLLQTTSL
jgi:membrane protease YdiL (CAAX protease family)